MSNSPIQKILFGSPGTGKSYRVTGKSTEDNQSIKDQLGITDNRNVIKTVFHPEYTYGDFIGKLLPQTTGENSVIYKYYSGYFFKALGRAYRNIIDLNNHHVLLVIDELNRGNAPAIFGTIFQLLDRNTYGWSEYEVNISELEKIGLLNSMGYSTDITNKGLQVNGNRYDIFLNQTKESLRVLGNYLGEKILNIVGKSSISIPFNLSIVATINTSDESIYYLDSAFKRRWDWEYIEAPHSNTLVDNIPESIRKSYLYLGNNHGVKDEREKLNWAAFVICLNEFIKSKSQVIKKIDDKQIGWWFISPDSEGRIKIETLKNKLMFYLWDSVFSRDKRPLEDFLKDEVSSLITYGDFVDCAEKFIFKIYRDFGGEKKETEIIKSGINTWEPITWNEEEINF